jgi:histidinol phosphatase-like PHP family hydrolase
MSTRAPRPGRSPGPANAALAEALFSLSEHEPSSERRLALLKAGYTAFDAEGSVNRRLLDGAPTWLRPLISQLLACRGRGALEAAVQRLASGGTPRRRGTRSDFLARSEVASILAGGPAELEPSRMRGAMHWHTTDSDGRATLEVMARACRRRGASWAMVADHSRGLEVASGLDREALSLQRRRVRRWNDQHGDELRLLQGVEVEILDDGTVDVPHSEREEVDCVLAAVHRTFDPGRDQTERLLRAVSTPGVHVLAHPRGRLFHHRPGLRARWEKVFSACAEHGVAIEINGFPRRQDLDWDLARVAAECGCTFALASDAHAPAHLEFDAFACAIAMRAGIPRGAVLNVRQPEDVELWLGER